MSDSDFFKMLGIPVGDILSLRRKMEYAGLSPEVYQGIALLVPTGLTFTPKERDRIYGVQTELVRIRRERIV